MAGFIPRQLTPLLGGDLYTLEEALLNKLIGFEEGDELEFKRKHYGRDDAQRLELALDLTSFANTRGGLLIVGMEEDAATGRAEGLRPLVAKPHGTEEDVRYRQVTQQTVFPPIEYHTAWVPVTDGDVLVVGVPPSPDQPHAVGRGEDGLRFPVRDGRRKRLLRAGEVVAAYRRQFDTASAAIERLSSMRAGLVDEVVALPPDPMSNGRVWLVLALAPDRPGSLRLDRDAVFATETWAAGIRTVPTEDFMRPLGATAGFRAVRLTDEIDGYATDEFSATTHSRMHLATSGAGVAAVRVDARNRGADEPLRVIDDGIFIGAVAAAELLAAHAIDRCGTGGSATMLVNLVPDPFARMQLVSRGHAFSGDLGPISRTRPVLGSTPIGQRTVVLEDLWPLTQTAVAAVVEALSDVTGPFGLAAPEEADRDGRLRERCIDRSYFPMLERWATDRGIDIVDRLHRT